MPQQRLAVLVGTDYVGTPYALSECRKDALRMHDILNGRRFDIAPLLDGACTRQAILDAIATAASAAKPGDLFVLTYSGHGTTVPDMSGEEGAYDQAICPDDFASGRLLVDDDIRTALSAFDPAVNVQCYFDCCYSGSITRLLAQHQSAPPGGRRQVKRARFVMLPQLAEMHRAFRAASDWLDPEQRAEVRRVVKALNEPIRHAAYQACKDTEVAYETAGKGGDFTTRLVQVLGSAGSTIMRKTVHERVLAAFGEQRWQTPVLDTYPGGERQRIWSAVK